jgi:Kef-type K+ transport system membrane component KefB
VAVRIAVFFVVAVMAGRLFTPFLRWASKLEVSQGLLAAVLFVALIYSWAAEYFGAVAAITGSYVAGVLFAQTPFKKEIDDGVHPLTYSMFVPIFFISIGLQVNGRELGQQITFTLMLILVAIAAKAIGCGVSARACGFTNIESVRVGVGMISRGEVGLIVASYGLANGLIDQNVFSASVLMVLATTMVTPVLLRQTFPQEPAAHAMVEETIAGPPEETDALR